MIIVRVKRRDGQAEGKPNPVRAIESPLSEPLKIEAVNVVLKFRARELVYPTGSSLTLTKYAPPGTFGTVKLT